MALVVEAKPHLFGKRCLAGTRHLVQAREATGPMQQTCRPTQGDAERI
jgi:hypothetical protein